MKTREVWAPPTWYEGSTFAIMYRARRGSSDVRVLVQEIPEGRPSRPDFNIGDKVRTWLDDALVVGLPSWTEDSPMKGAHWRVTVYSEGNGLMQYDTGTVTKLPRETSRLIRVTGPEENVGDFMTCVEHWNRPKERVRVEVVDDPEGGER